MKSNRSMQVLTWVPDPKSSRNRWMVSGPLQVAVPGISEMAPEVRSDPGTVVGNDHWGSGVRSVAVRGIPTNRLLFGKLKLDIRMS